MSLEHLSILILGVCQRQFTSVSHITHLLSGETASVNGVRRESTVKAKNQGERLAQPGGRNICPNMLLAFYKPQEMCFVNRRDGRFPSAVFVKSAMCA